MRCATATRPQEGLFKIAEDPRVTRVGRLLRRSALDELPQLWNIVARGDEPRRAPVRWSSTRTSAWRAGTAVAWS